MRLLLVATLLCCLSCLAQSSSDIENLRQTINEYRSRNSITYNINYKIKTFDNDDTIRIDGKCRIIRLTTDPVYKSKFHMLAASVGHHTERIYDGSLLYVTENNNRSGTTYNPTVDGKMGLAGRHDAQLLNTHFFSKSSSALDDPKKLKSWHYKVKDAIIAAVEIALPDNEVTGQKLTIHFEVATRKILKTTYYAILGDQHQYDEWNFSKITFNDFTEKQLSQLLQKMKTTVVFKAFDLNATPKVIPLHEGSAAPIFTGINADGSTFDFSHYKGKVLVLDFFYMACHPCTKAIPGLVNLQKKYGEKLQVLGLDPYDIVEKQKVKMPAFISKMKINYPVVFIEQKTAEEYKIEAYPTTLILDRNGMIVKQIRGYSESLEAEIEAVVSELIAN